MHSPSTFDSAQVTEVQVLITAMLYIKLAREDMW